LNNKINQSNSIAVRVLARRVHAAYCEPIAWLRFQQVPSRFQIEWARVCAIVFRELSWLTNEIDHHRERLADFNLKLERRIKMFFILRTLFLRKIKGDGKLLSNLRTRFRHWKINQWMGENCPMSEHGPWSKTISRNEGTESILHSAQCATNITR